MKKKAVAYLPLGIKYEVKENKAAFMYHSLRAILTVLLILMFSHSTV